MSRVLLMGATGFIGARLLVALRAGGHEVIAAARSRAPGLLHADLARDVRIDDWTPRLAGIDVLVNAAGAFVDHRGASLEAVHATGPRAMFDAAVQCGVRRIIQISALASDMSATRFLSTKQDADSYLMSLPVESLVIRPAPVFGPGGGSASMLMALATAPMLLVPRALRGDVQPVHVDDVVAAVVASIGSSELPRTPLAVVGAHPLPMVEFVQLLRSQLGLPRARVLYVPDALARFAGAMPPLSRSGLLGADALRMLSAGSTADPEPLTRLLRRPPRSPDDFVGRTEAPTLAREATLAWTLPLLRWSIALLWFASGLVSLGIYPVEQSHALLALVGIPESLWSLSLYGASALDIALGFAVLLAPHHTLVWRVQIVLVLVYSVIISIWLPEFWLHPFGPLVKNIPLLAAFYMLQRLAQPRWNT